MRYSAFLLTLMISVLSAGRTALACDCNSQGNFLKVAPKAALVALVKISKYLTYQTIYKEQIPVSMEVEITEVYRGKEAKKIITIWGDDGMMCRPYLSEFSVGKYYVIAFYKTSNNLDEKQYGSEKVTNYFISNCGEYWLNANTDKPFATTIVTGRQTRIKLSNLKSRLSVN